MARAAALVSVLIVERPMCVDCISEKCGLRPATIEATLARLARFLKVHYFPKARCRACGENRPTYSIDRPAG